MRRGKSSSTPRWPRRVQIRVHLARLACASSNTTVSPATATTTSTSARQQNTLQKKLISDCRERGYELVKQPRNSPCTNIWDLGLFHALKSALQARGCEVGTFDNKNKNQIQAELWRIVKDTWAKLDPHSIFNISTQRRAVLEAILENDGREVREVHTDIRRTLKPFKGEKLDMDA